MYHSHCLETIKKITRLTEKAGNCDDSQEKGQSMEFNSEMIQILESEVKGCKAAIVTMLTIFIKTNIMIMSDKKPCRKEKLSK